MRGRLPAVLLLALCGCGGAVTNGGGEGEPLARYGMSVVLPDGWRGRITRATVQASTAAEGSPLGAGDVRVRMFEFDPEAFGSLADEAARGYDAGPPRLFSQGDFGPPEGSEDNPGKHGFARRNFSLAGRYFNLFVEAGTLTPPEDAVAALNDLVASLQVQRGDFYPGTIEPPRFPPASGWYVGSGGGGEVRASDYAEAWAATVPYRNSPRDLPPSETVEALPDDGILIWVGLARDNRFPPTDELRRNGPPVEVPLRLSDAHGCTCFEGVPDNWLARLYGRIGEEYYVDLWVFFGRPDEPSAEQRARAQAMLDRLELPDWGPWEVDGR